MTGRFLDDVIETADGLGDFQVCILFGFVTGFMGDGKIRFLILAAIDQGFDMIDVGMMNLGIYDLSADETSVALRLQQFLRQLFVFIR